jgi:hypothetical protein
MVGLGVVEPGQMAMLTGKLYIDASAEGGGSTWFVLCIQKHFGCDSVLLLLHLCCSGSSHLQLGM